MNLVSPPEAVATIADGQTVFVHPEKTTVFA